MSWTSPPSFNPSPKPAATPPDHAELIASRIPGARLEIVPDARHLATIEHPEALTQLIVSHFTA